MRVSTFYSVTITRKDWEICYNYRRKIIGKRVCIVSISLRVSSRSPTPAPSLSSCILLMDQTMPVLPGPPVQMPSVISVSSVVGAANPATHEPPFHLNAHKHTWAPGKQGLWSVLVERGSLPILFTNLCQSQHYGTLDKGSSGPLALV